MPFAVFIAGRFSDIVAFMIVAIFRYFSNFVSPMICDGNECVNSQSDHLKSNRESTLVYTC